LRLGAIQVHEAISGGGQAATLATSIQPMKVLRGARARKPRGRQHCVLWESRYRTETLPYPDRQSVAHQHGSPGVD
jgi:hypothetical protein